MKFLTTITALIFLFLLSADIEATQDEWRANQKIYLQMLFDEQYEELAKVERRLKQNRAVDWRGQREIFYFYYGLARKNQDVKNFTTLQEYENRRELLDLWVARTNGSSVAKLTKLWLEYLYAAEIRGGDWAYRTLDSKLEHYRNHLAMVLKQAEALEPEVADNMVYWDLILTLGSLSSWPHEKFEATYRKAISVEPDYLLVHAERVSNYLPRWNGNPQLYDEVMNQTLKDNHQYFGDKMYALLEYNNQRGMMFEYDEVDWHRFKKSFEAIIEESPVRHAYLNFAVMACDAEEWTDLQKIFTSLDQPLTADEWPNKDFRYCESYAKFYDGARSVAEMQNIKNLLQLPKPVRRYQASPQDEIDRQRLLAVTDKELQYATVREVVRGVARKNPNTLYLVDELDIRLTIPDLYFIVYRLSSINLEIALDEMDRLIGTAYEKRIRTRLKRLLKVWEGSNYDATLVLYPHLWEQLDIPQLRMPPEDLLSTLADENLFGDSSRDRQLKQTAGTTFYQEYPELVLDFIRQLKSPSNRLVERDIERLLIQVDPVEALRFTLHLNPEGGRSMESLIAIINRGQDPIAALDTLDVTLSEYVLSAVIRELAFHNPKLASTYLSRIPKYRSSVQETTRLHFSDRYKCDFKFWLQENPEWMTPKDFRALVERDPDLAMQIASETEDEALKKQRLKMIAEPEYNHELAGLELPQSRAEGDRIEQLMQVYFEDPQLVMNWFTRHADTVPPVSVHLVAALLLDEDDVDVYNWLKDFPRSEVLREIRTAVFRETSERNPKLMVQELREGTVTDVDDPFYLLSKAWLRSDSAAALEWIRSVTDWSDEQLIGELALALGETGQMEMALHYAIRIRTLDLRLSVIRRFPHFVQTPEELEIVANELGWSDAEKARQLNRRFGTD